MGYKLNYFNLRGRAETIRLIFVLAGQEFEDVRFPREEWPQYKAKSPSGQAPFLETPDGNILVQSRAIQRYLANKFGLNGSNDTEKYRIDVVSETLGDILQSLIAIHFAPDEEAKKKAGENFFNVKGPVLFKTLTTLLSHGKLGAVTGDKTSWADLEIFALIDSLQGKPETKAFVENYPDVTAHAQAIRELPKIAEYLKTRPVTEM